MGTVKAMAARALMRMKRDLSSYISFSISILSLVILVAILLFLIVRIIVAYFFILIAIH